MFNVIDKNTENQIYLTDLSYGFEKTTYFQNRVGSLSEWLVCLK